MNKLHLFLALLLTSLLLFSSCEKEETTTVTPAPTPPMTIPSPPASVEHDFRIGSYNVENLFDTEDDLDNGQDDEYLPTANKRWTDQRYRDKLQKIGVVVEGIAFPVLMGLAEVENRTVLEDLVATDLLKDKNYEIVHFDSPDFRGIDVALIYQATDFTILETTAIKVRLPIEVSEFSTTRDILQVKGSYLGEEIYVFVNHWPSRSGGQAQTNGKRTFAASVLRNAVDNILAEDANANIVILGDFNDEPFDPSMTESLRAKTEKPTTFDNELYNCTLPVLASGIGSYWFRGDWQMLDQAVVSGQLLDDAGKMKVVGYNVYSDRKVMFDHPTDGLRPNRTYGGNEYYGGYSDHLAVYLEVKHL